MAGAGDDGSEKARDEAARERLAAIGEIAAEVAHELRNALQVIASSAYLARVDLAASGPHVAKIERNARLAQSIVDDLMALARGEPAHAEPVHVVEILMATRAEMPPAAAEWNDVIVPSDLKIRAHLGLLTRALHAIYDNAIAVCAPRAPAIETRVAREGDRVVIEITDDGPGVPPAIAPRLFEPLVTGRAGGSGLGLALAKRVVAAHGGTIVLVESATGAKFRIELPA